MYHLNPARFRMDLHYPPSAEAAGKCPFFSGWIVCWPGTHGNSVISPSLLWFQVCTTKPSSTALSFIYSSVFSLYVLNAAHPLTRWQALSYVPGLLTADSLRVPVHPGSILFLREASCGGASGHITLLYFSFPFQLSATLHCHQHLSRGHC